MQVQQTIPTESDPVLKYGLWFGILAVLPGVILGSIICIYSGKAVGVGLAGLLVASGIAGGIASYRWGK